MIDSLCFPRLMARGFHRLLGDGAGHRRFGDGRRTRNPQLPGSRHGAGDRVSTPTGAVTIIDALAVGDGNRGHQLGKDAPHVLVRRATCIEGEVKLRLEYAPRPDYGVVSPLLDVIDGGLTAVGGPTFWCSRPQ